MPSPLLAFRPASVVGLLAPRSEACPLSTRELLAPARAAGIVLPLVHAPIAAVARGALVAARELDAVLGLALPPGVPPEPWFAAVARAADEVAGGLPVFLAGEVVVEGEAEAQVERAARRAWRLVAAGLTHVAVDLGAVAPDARAPVGGEVARPAAEQGACVDVVLSLADGMQGVACAAALLDELAGRGVAPDLVSVRCPAPVDADEARSQAGALARVCQALSGAPLLRRGPVTSDLLERLRGSPLRGCDDGGAAAAQALDLVPLERAADSPPAEDARESPLERAAATLPGDAAERVEARAYVDALEFMERLGARGSAGRIGAALRSRLAER